MNMPVTVAPLVALRRLEIGLGPPERPPVVDGIDLDIGRGETVALVGESGSGKSLVAHTIAGIVTKIDMIDFLARRRADRFDHLAAAADHDRLLRFPFHDDGGVYARHRVL